MCWRVAGLKKNFLRCISKFVINGIDGQKVLIRIGTKAKVWSHLKYTPKYN